MRWLRKRQAHAEQTGQRAGLSAATSQPLFATVKLSGTTTFGAGALSALFRSRHLEEGIPHEVTGQLVAEPTNPADPHAIAVHVEGRRIGYLPGHLARHIEMHAGDTYPCLLQLWGANSAGQLRVQGWVARSDCPVEWPHTSHNPPPVTIEEQRLAAARQTTEMVDAALGGADPQRADVFRRGMVGSIHYLETVEPIKQLKREGRLDEALALCYGAIEASERARDEGQPSPPWYTEQAAIIHRKRGERDREVAVLERWLAQCPEDRREGSRIRDRLIKLQKGRGPA